MIVYITLLAAVGFEVAGTILLPLTRNFSKPLPSLFLQFFPAIHCFLKYACLFFK